MRTSTLVFAAALFLPAIMVGVNAKVDLHNPGNIKHGNAWLGETEAPLHKTFESFESTVYGYRAMYKVLATYHKDYGIDTVAGILNRYSPTSENLTGSYIVFVTEELDIDPLTKLDFEDYHLMKRLMIAMVKYEGNWIGDEFALDCGLISGGLTP